MNLLSYGTHTHHALYLLGITTQKDIRSDIFVSPIQEEALPLANQASSSLPLQMDIVAGTEEEDLEYDYAPLDKTLEAYYEIKQRHYRLFQNLAKR